jgi:K+-transporting ATPase ATPase C chain
VTKDIVTGLRLVIGTLLVCAVLYPAFLLGIGRVAVPARAEGSLIRDSSGTVIGSQLIAQEFRRPGYLWPRPSAASFDGSAAGGSNLSAGNPALIERAEADVARLRATPAGAVPGELVAASGSGLDPHITVEGALYQVDRIATARGVRAHRVEAILRHGASSGTPWSRPLVNVLEANLALDAALGPLKYE